MDKDVKDVGTWMYHKDAGLKLFGTADEVERMKNEGWVETEGLKIKEQKEDKPRDSASEMEKAVKGSAFPAEDELTGDVPPPPDMAEGYKPSPISDVVVPAVRVDKDEGTHAAKPADKASPAKKSTSHVPHGRK